MAYLFGAGNSDIIDAGASVTHGATYSVLVRLHVTSVSAATRMLACHHDGTATANFYCYMSNDLGNNTVALGMSTAAGTLFPTVFWLSGFTAGSEHVIMATYDGANMRLYADTDATAKATQPESGTPDQGGTQHFSIGGQVSATVSADATLYEVGWWPGTVLSGAQCAQLGAGNASGIPLPTDYYGLVRSPLDKFGGKHGTVTGASIVAHVGANLYPTRQSATLVGVS